MTFWQGVLSYQLQLWQKLRKEGLVRRRRRWCSSATLYIPGLILSSLKAILSKAIILELGPSIGEIQVFLDRLGHFLQAMSGPAITLIFSVGLLRYIFWSFLKLREKAGEYPSPWNAIKHIK
ncbi:MAG: hypothetical protein PHH44_00545 [bacterium]|nr:hypothetical protein [bacterium]